eukprot:354551-Chlamydomonas_euryale.AAC.18
MGNSRRCQCGSVRFAVQHACRTVLDNSAGLHARLRTVHAFLRRRTGLLLLLLRLTRCRRLTASWASGRR